MNNPLQQFGNIPVTASALESVFPDVKRGDQKLRLLEREKQIVRLKKGLYVCSPEVTGKALSSELVANHLCSASYVSMFSALRYYGLIPESVYVMQSMTLKRSKTFDTSMGRFEYVHISREAFPVGLTSVVGDGYAFVMASPEKALCDLVANSPLVSLRYLKDARTYLEEDIRMDMDAFIRLDADIFAEYAQVGKKAESVRTLLKLLGK